MDLVGHVYQWSGPVAAHGGLKRVNELYSFLCSYLLPATMQVSVDGVSLKIIQSTRENDENVVYAERA